MLTDLEQKRLENRESEDARTRAVNDSRIKKKLTAWLEDASDALNILQNIPLEKLKDGLSDTDVYRLLTISEHIMAAKNFTTIEGELGVSDLWTASGIAGPHPANYIDIGRTSLIQEHVDELQAYIGGKNPVTFGKFVYKIINNPAKNNTWKDRFTPEEKEGARRIIESEREYILEFAQKDKKEDPK